MRRPAAAFLCVLVLGVSGCFGRHKPQAPAAAPVPAPGFDAVRRRAEESHDELEGKKRKAPHRAKAPVQAAEAEAGPEEPEVPRARQIGKDPSGCVWVESEADVSVGENDGPHQVRAMAITKARQSAMQDFLGVEVKSRFLDFQQETLRGQENLTESMLQTTRLGRILDEKVSSYRYVDLPGCPHCRFHLVLRTCLMPVPDYADKDFQVELSISPRTSFVEGDAARLVLTANRDCFVYLYNVGMKGETALVVPNEMVAEARLKAGESWEYPDESVRKRGVRLVAQLPEGSEVSQETIRVIASRTPVPAKLRDPMDGGFLGILRRMNATRIDWSEDAAAFTISRH